MKRKPTEFGLHSYASMMSVVQFEDLNVLESQDIYNEKESCYIYMICSRQRVTVNKDNSYYIGNDFNFGFKIQRQDTYEECSIRFPCGKGKHKAILESNYPYNFFSLLFEDGGGIKAKVSTFLSSIPEFGLNRDFLDLNVLYVGQSYGANGSRTALDRLKKHETLQKILSDVSTREPDKEVWLMLYSFKQNGLTLFDGRTKFSEKEYNDDLQRPIDFINTISEGGIKEQQFINFTEAALIRYFKPFYNKNFKNIFPSLTHSSYSECYDLDVNTVAVELGTKESVNIMLYSDEVKRKPIHLAEFFMHNREERVSMFDFSNL